MEKPQLTQREAFEILREGKISIAIEDHRSPIEIAAAHLLNNQAQVLPVAEEAVTLGPTLTSEA